MSEYRISGRLDAETGEVYEKLRDDLGFQGQRKDTRFIKALLSVIQELVKRDLVVVTTEPSATLSLRPDATEKVSASNMSDDQETTEAVSGDELLASLGVSEQEYEEIAQACERSYGSLDELMRVAILTEARKCNESAKKVMELDLTNPDKRGRVRGAGYAYVESVVQQIMDANLKAEKSEDLTYITAGQIAKMTGTNRKDINTYFDHHRDMLDRHHKSIGFTTPAEGESHNRMKGYALRSRNYQSRN